MNLRFSLRRENIVSSLSHMTQEGSDKTDVTDSEQNLVSAPCRKLTQSQSEKLLHLTKEYYHQEKELKEKYHEVVRELFQIDHVDIDL